MLGINLNTRSNTWVFWKDQPKNVSLFKVLLGIKALRNEMWSMQDKDVWLCKSPKIPLLIYSNIHHMEEPVERPLTVQFDSWSSVCLPLFTHCLI